MLPKTATEGLLCSQDGELLEGFVSNLFIVQQSDTGLVVKTAVNGVLAGIKQREVLDACLALSIPTQCKGAIKQQRHLWVEAFLTNAVTGGRPIKSITRPANNALHWEAWEVHFPAPGDSSVSAQVQDHMQKSCQDALFCL